MILKILLINLRKMNLLQQKYWCNQRLIHTLKKKFKISKNKNVELQITLKLIISQRSQVVKINFIIKIILSTKSRRGMWGVLNL